MIFHATAGCKARPSSSKEQVTWTKGSFQKSEEGGRTDPFENEKAFLKSFRLQTIDPMQIILLILLIGLDNFH